MTGDSALRAYAGLLRETLQALVAASPAGDAVPWQMAEAERVLGMETARQAAAEWQVLTDICGEGYVLADYCYYQIYGVPRSPSGLVPTTEDVKAALATLTRLTVLANQLEADTRRGRRAPDDSRHT